MVTAEMAKIAASVISKQRVGHLCASFSNLLVVVTLGTAAAILTKQSSANESKSRSLALVHSLEKMEQQEQGWRQKAGSKILQS